MLLASPTLFNHSIGSPIKEALNRDGSTLDDVMAIRPLPFTNKDVMEGLSHVHLSSQGEIDKPLKSPSFL